MRWNSVQLKSSRLFHRKLKNLTDFRFKRLSCGNTIQVSIPGQNFSVCGHWTAMKVKVLLWCAVWIILIGKPYSLSYSPFISFISWIATKRLWMFKCGYIYLWFCVNWWVFLNVFNTITRIACFLKGFSKIPCQS